MSAICQSCNQPRAELYNKNSKIMPGVSLLLCNSCITQKFEPRWIIILHGRQHGISSVAEYVQKHRYVGEEIEARNFLN